MFVIENEKDFTKLVEKCLENVLNRRAEQESIISGWPAIEQFLGIKHHQIKVNFDNGLYGDAIQIRGRQVFLNTRRFWEVMQKA